MTCRPGGHAGSPWETIGLSIQAAGFVDSPVAPFAHRIRPAEVDPLVAEAVGRFMPAEAAAARQPAADGRYFSIHHTQVSFAGTSYVHGELDLADARDLETAVAHGAAVLAACGSDQTLEVRRSQAVGEIALPADDARPRTIRGSLRTVRWHGRRWCTSTSPRAARSPGSRPAAAGS